jgi:nucleoside-diphosphate-sugar epimerase
MQTILGSGGAIGTELARALTQYTNDVRLVSRNPKKVTGNETLFPADLSNAAEIDRAVEGSEIVYITIGFDYFTKVWQAKWPPFMRATIDACVKHGAKLVFFDNVYMYAESEIPNMTENSRIDPSSKKGLVRKEIADMLMEAVSTHKLQAIIARAADFYGVGVDKSVVYETVYKNLEKGKKAQWPGNPKYKHSFTWTPDAAKGTALLGNTPDAYNQVWHLPTDKNALTGEAFAGKFSVMMNAKPGVSPLPNWLVSCLALFIPFMKEFREMMYQYDRDYVFDSSKFQKHFPDFRITTYEEGIKQIVNAN